MPADILVYPRETLFWERAPLGILYVFMEGPIYTNKHTHEISALGMGMFLCCEPRMIQGTPGIAFKISSQIIRLTRENACAGTLTISNALEGGRTLIVKPQLGGALAFFIGDRRLTCVRKESLRLEISPSVPLKPVSGGNLVNYLQP